MFLESSVTSVVLGLQVSSKAGLSGRDATEWTVRHHLSPVWTLSLGNHRILPQQTQGSLNSHVTNTHVIEGYVATIT